MSEKITTFKNGIGLNESELKKFDEMDCAKDIQIFSKKNKIHESSIIKRQKIKAKIFRKILFSVFNIKKPKITGNKTVA